MVMSFALVYVMLFMLYMGVIGLANMVLHRHSSGIYRCYGLAYCQDISHWCADVLKASFLAGAAEGL